MKSLNHVFLSLLLFAAAIHAARAAGQDQRQSGASLMRATQVLDLDIRDISGRQVGEVQDAIVQMDSGAISHIIAKVDGLARLADGTYAIRAGWLRVDGSQQEPFLRLDATAEQLRRMPRWESPDRSTFLDVAIWDEPDRMARPRLSEGFYSFTLTDLIGADVQGAEGQRVGKLADLVLDLNGAESPFGVIAFDPGILSGERNVAVPIERFLRPRLDLENGASLDHLVLNISREQARSLKGFDEDRWPDLRDERLLKEMRGRFIMGQAPDEEELTFGSLDGNRDGYINRTEAMDNERLSRRWNFFDENRDGLIAPDEFTRGARLPRRG